MRRAISGIGGLIAALSASAALAAGVRTYNGPATQMRWGPIQVTIRVRGKHLVDLSASAPMHRPLSRKINKNALPTLRLEALKAQRAHINIVSGATLTSNAFAESLCGALISARLHC